VGAEQVPELTGECDVIVAELAVGDAGDAILLREEGAVPRAVLLERARRLVCAWRLSSSTTSRSAGHRASTV
jgi:hypothetical protein